MIGFEESELIKAIEDAARDVIGDGEETPGTITTREFATGSGLSERHARRILRGLVGAGVVEAVMIKRRSLHGHLRLVPGYRLADR